MIRWDPVLKKGITGDSIHTYIPDETKTKIVESIKEYFPPGSKYDMQILYGCPIQELLSMMIRRMNMVQQFI